MIRVSLLGDSVRQIGYGPLMSKELGDKYSVWQPDDNYRFARYTLRMLFDYRAELAMSDIIQFNNGLWDACDLFGDGPFTDPKEYKQTILRIATLLQKITPHIIFATTTPVRKENHYNTSETSERYNRLVVGDLKKMGVIINDLYGTINEDVIENIRQDDCIHLTEKGALLAAKQTAEVIRSIKITKPKEAVAGSFISKNGAPI